MHWPVLELRFAIWFAEAAARGDHMLASRLAGVAVQLRTADRFSDSLRLLLDELENAEALLQRGGDRVENIETLQALVGDFEELFRPFEGDDPTGSCEEDAVLYLSGEPSPSGGRSR